MNKIILKYTTLKPVLLLLVAVMCLAACKKEKLDTRKDNRATTQPRQSSTARIINLANFNQVIADGKTLTDSVYRDPDGPDGGKNTGTDYFPKTGKIGTSWAIPQALFDAANSIQLKFGFVGRSSESTPTAQVTLPAIKEEYNKPMDYYLLPTRMASTLPQYAAIERGVTQPSKPDHFKIRIVNLTAPVDGAIFSPRGKRENLAGPVTLTFADGTPVDTKTTGITQEQRNSEYVEVPYGTYQFKVLTADGRQIPGAAPANSNDGVLDPPTSCISVSAGGAINNSLLTFAPINTYQPGGVYTIVVTPYSFNYLSSPSFQAGGAYQNAFYIITDVNAPVNISYCRMQGANALPRSGTVSFRINGQTLQQANYGEASAYNNLIQGDYTIEALNTSGMVLATLRQTFRAGQNYTAWLFPDGAGKAQILFVPNDLSGINNLISNGQDASLSVFRQDYIFYKRCLNLSPDNGYITFTFDNGRPAMANMLPGVLSTGNPYVNEGPSFYRPFEMMAYRSAPDVVPGTWARDIEVLKSKRFVARTSLYTDAGREIPENEPGVYTVALIGRSATGTPDAEKARFIIVKHNK